MNRSVPKMHFPDFNIKRLKDRKLYHNIKLEPFMYRNRSYLKKKTWSFL
jgi:hypothetical protein